MGMIPLPVLKKNLKNISISIITYIEVLSFDLNKHEKEIILELLNNFEIIGINMEIANQALINREIKKIKIPDNLIASSAQIFDKTLITRNISDFSKLDLKVINIFE